jgi:hypothetical protein
MLYAAYVPAVGIYGIGETILDALKEAEPHIEPEERQTLTIVPTTAAPDTEADCCHLKVRRCTEDLAKLYYEHGVMTAFDINKQGLLDLKYIS